MLFQTAFRLLSRTVLHPYFRLTRGQTLGVRGVVRDASGAFLLVRHTYAPGWIFPGGGVERDETLEDALRRELGEEVGVSYARRPQLLGVFANGAKFKGDHIALFLIDDWEQEPVRSLEIAEYRFFAATDLPDTVMRGTQRRIAEIVEGSSPDPVW